MKNVKKKQAKAENKYSKYAKRLVCLVYYPIVIVFIVGVITILLFMVSYYIATRTPSYLCNSPQVVRLAKEVANNHVKNNIFTMSIFTMSRGGTSVVSITPTDSGTNHNRNAVCTATARFNNGYSTKFVYEVSKSSNNIYVRGVFTELFDNALNQSLIDMY